MKKLLLILTLLVSSQTNAMLSRMARVMPATRVAMQQARFAHCHTVLGVSNNASEEEIKAAYFKSVKTAHPDSGGSAEAFQKINQAYEEALSTSKSNFSYSDFSHSSCDKSDPFEELLKRDMKAAEQARRDYEKSKKRAEKAKKEYEEFTRKTDEWFKAYEKRKKIREKEKKRREEENKKFEKRCKELDEFTEQQDKQQEELKKQHEESLIRKSYNDACKFGGTYSWNKQMMNWGKKTIVPSKVSLLLTKGAATAVSFPAMVAKNIGFKIWRKVKGQ